MHVCAWMHPCLMRGLQPPPLPILFSKAISGKWSTYLNSRAIIGPLLPESTHAWSRHKHRRRSTHTHDRTYTCTHIHKYTRTCIHIHTHSHIHKWSPTQTACNYWPPSTREHTYLVPTQTQTQKHTCAHSHIHMHTHS